MWCHNYITAAPWLQVMWLKYQERLMKIIIVTLTWPLLRACDEVVRMLNPPTLLPTCFYLHACNLHSTVVYSVSSIIMVTLIMNSKLWQHENSYRRDIAWAVPVAWSSPPPKSASPCLGPAYLEAPTCVHALIIHVTETSWKISVVYWHHIYKEAIG